MSSHEAKSQAKQNSDNVLGLLRLFLDTHHLSLEDLAGLLGITPQTLEEWFSEGMRHPRPVWPLQSSSTPEGKYQAG
jgi:hypothetical protein